ncbi:ribonuclease HII [Patescibacteria group bacterium]|nr:MAG: ribonuclease HII [Patescibacteria group bacterium]
MKTIIGIDEAGRGPLAGPVAVGVVAVSETFDFASIFPGLNDSKKLSEKKREALFLRLQEEMKVGTVRAVVCLSSAEVIDEKGISFAISNALAKGVRKLMPNPFEGKVYLDGSLKAPEEYEQETIIGGDALVPAIMLASIAAKVTRDRFMVQLSKDEPRYGFETHKGYGTKAHIEALHAYGVSPFHRKTFLSRIMDGTISS